MDILNANLRAKDVMAAEPVCVEPSMTIPALLRLFEEHEISGAPVVDREGHVIGVLSRTDLIRHGWKESVNAPSSCTRVDVFSDKGRDEDEGSSRSLVCVEDFMNDDPVMATPNTPAHLVAHLMSDKRTHRVVIVNQDRFPVGIVTSLDLLGAYPQERAI